MRKNKKVNFITDKFFIKLSTQLLRTDLNIKKIQNQTNIFAKDDERNRK